MRALLCLFAVTVIANCSSTPKKVSVEEKFFTAWIELGPGNSQIVRAVTSKQTCPDAKTDKGVLTLTKRVGPPQWPVLVCEANAPKDAKIATVDHQELKLLIAHPKKILIIGDTGCRIKPGGTIAQACNDAKEWPFTAVSKTAAAWNPDLVIHVGDYHYREGDCPKGNAGCADSISGDNWASWNQDFLVPADPLLKAAPWIIVRGNHELCNRGGLGWFALLEPRAYQKCSDEMAPFKLDIDGHELWDVDAASDQTIVASLSQIPRDQKTLRWVLIHRPFLTPGALSLSKPPVTIPAADMTAFNLVLAGHVHTLSLNAFKTKSSPELIIGNGGTELDKFTLPYVANKDVIATMDRGFGFLTMEELPRDHWAVVVHNVQGETVKTCVLSEKAGRKTALSCH